MHYLIQILSHTPAWVYVLFAFLASRGISAMKPGEISPLKLTIVPTLLTGWGLFDLIRLYGLSATSFLPWLCSLAVGAVAGWIFVRGRVIEVDRAAEIIKRPADYTSLPLILIAFGVKYAFAVIATIAPERLADPSFRLVDLTLSGILAGIFVGKLACYLTRYFNRAASAHSDPKHVSVREL